MCNRLLALPPHYIAKYEDHMTTSPASDPASPQTS